MPHLRHERRIGGVVAGVDEVGRGPLAGPVLAAAVILPARLPRALRTGIDDSKKLSAARRVEMFAVLRAAGAEISIAAASVAEIDALNIFWASMLAMRRAIARLPRPPQHVLVDGKSKPGCAVPCTAIVGGDGISLSIAAASIAAKVTRDALMVKLHLRHPAYHWQSNAGYAARQHRQAITLHGVTRHHRASFGEVIRALEAARLNLDEVEPPFDPLKPQLDPVHAI